MDQPASPIELELRSSPYKWIQALARGAMGEVHVVEHRELGTRGALKILRAELSETELAARLRAEARLLTFMTHPNLVRVLDFGWTELRRPYLVSELLEGETLGARLKREETLDATDAAEITLQTLRGLEVVHKNGIVHRDIKPDNLFLTGSGRKLCVKILDLGVAKILSAATRHAAGGIAPTAEGTLIGTPSYVAPEQIASRRLDARADLYGLGAVLFRMLAGTPPFVRSDQIELLRAHLMEEPVFPARRAAEPPEIERVALRLQQIALRALAKDPEDRFASASVMALAIEAALQPPPLVRAVVPRGRTERIELADVPTVRIVPAAKQPPEPKLAEIEEDTYLTDLRRRRTRPIQPLLRAPLVAEPTPLPQTSAAPLRPATTDRRGTAGRARTLRALRFVAAAVVGATLALLLVALIFALRGSGAR